MNTQRGSRNYWPTDFEGNVFIPYGNAPQIIGQVELKPVEQMLYLYLPVMMPNDESIYLPSNLTFLDKVLQIALEDAYKQLPDFILHHAYLTVKTMWVGGSAGIGNRPGWHADGFGSHGDLNYVWYNLNPTQFAVQHFAGVSTDDSQCLIDLEEQVHPEYIVVYPHGTVLRLDESVVHRVNPIAQEGLRTFIKISISKNRYNLQGNSHNYMIDYDWEMHDRSLLRNTDNKDFVR